MAITQAYNGSATIGAAEFSLPNGGTVLTPIATPGIYQLFLDLSTLTATESYRLQIKEKVQAASVQRLVQDVILSGSQAEPVYVTPSLILFHGWDMTLTKIGGTDRAIAYSIRLVA